MFYATSGDIVYEANINTQTQEYISIDVSDWEYGIYQVRFVCSTGQYMYGTFEIE
ncbi:DUF3244 domain-containing protein [Maribellus maritimus]|uniref:DUF3244 domain-containing protein n=1 Tax=Maribellus maritimus TaxID=2870838 RepID=UPI00374CA6D7|nr:DUF3244 domain-containing protein [Maribellus maritimus]